MTQENMLHNRVVLITGAARRVGAAIARELHRHGARVALHYHTSTAQALALAETLNAGRPDSARTFMADLRDTARLPALVAEVAAWGALYGLVNCASSFYATPLGRVDEAAWSDLIGSNLKGPLFLSQAAATHLTASGGAIVNITDIHAVRPLPGYPVYSAAKGGLATLTRALALELAPRVRVNAVAPGAIQWPEDGSAYDAEARARILAHTPLGRVGDPTDIARTVRFLLADAPYITGETINVDGGRSALLM